MITPIHPPALKKGDCIGVFAPSSYIEKEDIEKSSQFIKDLGYNVFIHPQTYERHHQSAGTTLQKSLAFQGLFMRPDIHAIWAAGGGNRALHLLDSINFQKIKDKPKLLLGFSDVTALLNASFAHTGLIGIHTQVFKNLWKYEQSDHLFSLLEGKKSSIPLENSTILHHGKATGHLVGGNLSIFHYLPQTLPNNFDQNAILFLEDCNEEPSKLDRMFLHLRRTGTLKNIKALVCGEFSNQNETGRTYGFTLEEIIKEHTENLNIPVILNAPFGHGKKLYSLPIGGHAEIDTNSMSFTLSSPVSLI